MQNALQAQTRASNDARALASAQTALVRALEQSANHATSSSSAAASATAARGNASSGGQVTAAQIASDEASIQSADAQVAAAKQNLAAAQLSSPIAGTVAAVNVVPGQSVTATPSTPQFVIVGPGVDEVTTTVGASSIGSLKVGSKATITLDGSTNTLAGHVSSIGSLGTTSSSTTTYPVTISFDSPTTGLLDGANADAQIVLSQTASSVTIPTSAVHTIGSIRTVTVLQKGKPVTVQVTVGTIGPDLTQVLSGVKAGDVVVLADMATPLPTANTNTRALTGGGGGPVTVPRNGGGVTRAGG
jgi:HlyD family secretion protein